jgi:hypothetical protein
MKPYILFFIIVLLGPVTQVGAQANSNNTYHGSYPQYYFVRTVSGHGIIPTTSIRVIDKDGKSISVSFRDLSSKIKVGSIL